ncbi:hypothetical protein BAU16_07580 [Enterococcus sp. JM9B]|nr:hypothetical protein BAU16_07580 [Enterococcus sp. JM9B]
MKTAFFLTEMRRYDYTGSALANTILFGNKTNKELEMIKNRFSNYNWHAVKLDDIYNLLGQEDSQLIVVSTKAKAYTHALRDKYSNSRIITIEEITLNPNLLL